MPEHKDIRSTAFAASLGINVSFQIQDDGRRFKSILVGMKDGQYLIIHLPGALTLSPKLRVGMKLIMRYVHFGSVYGCMVTVQGLTVKPFPVLFLSYPKQVQCIELRKSRRLECMLPATAKGFHWEGSGMIRDISTGGVLFSMKTGPQHEHPDIEIGQSVLLKFPLLGMDGLQEFLGNVRRVEHDGKELRIGMQFEKVPQDILDKIETYMATIDEF